MVLRTVGDLNSEKLTVFFASFAAVTKTDDSCQDFAGSLAQFFQELPAIPTYRDAACVPAPSSSDLLQLFAMVKPPLEAVKSRGGKLNLWAIAGLKQNEVRTAGALAGLWQTDFGGDVSRDFLARYLEGAVSDVDWNHELVSGYHVFTEVNPLGDLTDRVDLVIETTGYLIGIEIKINAGLGKNQLERYASALASRALHIHKSPLLILLAPRSKENNSATNSTSWKDVSAAAREAAKRGADANSLIHQVIAQYGDYVAQH